MSQKPVNYKQDMPPQGGYKPITYKRIPTWAPKSSVLAAGVALLFPVAVWDYRRRKHIVLKQSLEDDEGRIAIEPLLEAESDRLLLWQMRRNRDEENELMKDVPGWKTGTWFGEPIFKTNPNLDEWIRPTYLEIYAHTRPRDMNRHMFDRQWLN